MAKNRDKKKGGKKLPPKMKAAAPTKAGKSKSKRGGEPKLKLPGKKRDRGEIVRFSSVADPMFLRWGGEHPAGRSGSALAGQADR